MKHAYRFILRFYPPVGKPWILALFILGGLGCAAQSGILKGPGGQTIYRDYFAHPTKGDKRVEIFWTKPEGNGPWPAVFLIHGHQETFRSGGEMYVENGYLENLAKRGYVAASVSQPGYGQSDGPAEFCGPFTQEAVLGAIEFLRRKPFVNPNKVALFGYSRGAIASSMVATRDPRLSAVILGGGAYDFRTWYPTAISGINRYIEQEAGTTPDAFRDRSAIDHVDKIRASVLVLHGEKDDRVPLTQAQEFVKKLKAAHVRCQFRTVPGAGHGIPRKIIYMELFRFLEKHLR
jgi:dipeptidyl aminopeptidase/acylaminoacyl peptidase